MNKRQTAGLLEELLMSIFTALHSVHQRSFQEKNASLDAILYYYNAHGPHISSKHLLKQPSTKIGEISA